jgi:formate dehydrogenase iron-sulfur subunit
MTGKRILIDTSKCTACKACQVACQQWHTLEAEDTTFTGSYTNPEDLSGATLTLIKFTEAEAGDKLRWLFFNNRCRHCQDPRCKLACPLKAIKRQANGIVRIDPDLCDPLACTDDPPYLDRPCQRQCPFKNGHGTGIPKWKYEKNGNPVETKMRKCDFCYNRLNTSPEAMVLKSPPFVSTDGKTKSALPSCQVTCIPGAITSGKADAMWTKATKRVNYLKTHGYPDANIYPADFPTHVIWVLIEKPEVYGLTPVY